jgi:hypothetical protein
VGSTVTGTQFTGKYSSHCFERVECVQ